MLTRGRGADELGTCLREHTSWRWSHRLQNKLQILLCFFFWGNKWPSSSLWTLADVFHPRGKRRKGGGDFKATRFLSCSLLNPPPLFWHYRNMPKPLCAQNREEMINNICFQVKYSKCLCLCECDVPDTSMSLYPNSGGLSWSLISSHTVYILFSHVCPVLTVSSHISLCSCRTCGHTPCSRRAVFSVLCEGTVFLSVCAGLFPPSLPLLREQLVESFGNEVGITREKHENVCRVLNSVLKYTKFVLPIE